MTLQFSLPGQLAALQFGVNEISAAISVLQFAGSFLSVDRDSTIFAALEKHYGIYFRRMPKHLETVQLNRSGTALGYGQRRIPMTKMLPDMKLDSVTGIATFVILILRYVERPEDIVEHIQSLLRGEFDIICGGKLQPEGPQGSKETLPFSMRDNIRAYVQGILDADADSEQHRNILTWFSQLSAKGAKAQTATTLSKYSHIDHCRFLKHLLSHSQSGDEIPAEFHTLSAGTAMIALAAMANGANVSLHCVVEENHRVSIPENHTTITKASPLLVVLWLVKPPTEVQDKIRVLGDSQKKRRKELGPRTLTLYGGDAEISQIVAQHLLCSDENHSQLWKAGMYLGGQATWELSLERHEVILRFSDAFLHDDTPAALKDLAKVWYKGPFNDRRQYLAVKAAIAYDQVYRYSNYRSIDESEVKKSLGLVLTGFAVGCLKSLISNRPQMPSTYALVPEALSGPDGLLEFCENLVDGRSLYEFLCIVGNVWGGMAPRLDFPDGKLVGIVCPEVNILLDVLNDPARVAQHGLRNGIMSLHTGSVPVLPRDPIYGAIMAGNPNPHLEYSTIDRSKKSMPQSDVSDVIFTLEPFKTNGSLSAIICGWESGDVAFQLDPYDVFQNLVRGQALGHRRPDIKIIPNKDLKLIHIQKHELAGLQYFKLEHVLGAIHVGSSYNWQVVAAGCALPERLIVVAERKECDKIHRAVPGCLDRFPLGSCLILCHPREEREAECRVEDVEERD